MSGFDKKWAPSRAVALFGTDEPAPQARRVAAGDYSFVLESGHVRDFRVGDVELLRAVAFLVRDAHWVTMPVEITGLEFTEDSETAAVTYRAATSGPGPRLSYSATIALSRDSGLHFEVEAAPSDDFVTNRTGFVVLHPVDNSAGKRLQIEHTDGTFEDAVFPLMVSPGQPAFDIRALTHEPVSGIRLTCRMDGEAFEMEDQRNWTDGSFKTYSRPLWKPRPFVIRGGEVVRQVVSATAEATAPVAARLAGEETVVVSIGEVGGSVPGIGISHHPAGPHLPDDVLQRYASLPIDHLHCACDPATDMQESLLRHAELVKRLESAGEIILEAVVSATDPGKDLSEIAAAAGAAGFAPARLAVFMREYLNSFQPTDPRPKTVGFDGLYSAARSAFPNTVIGGGTYTHFTELNRDREAANSADFVTHSTSPLVHDADDQAVMQSLEALPYIARTLRAFAPQKPHRISPATLALRYSPGGAVLENPERKRLVLAKDDPRWRGLFGASWMVGYTAEAAAAGVEAVTFGDLNGPSSFVSFGEGGFPEGLPYPVYHILAALAAASRRPRVPLGFSPTGTLRGLGWRTADGRLEALLANNSDRTTRAQLELPGRSARVSVLDADSIREGGGWRAEDADATRTIELAPYACVRLSTAA